MSRRVALGTFVALFVFAVVAARAEDRVRYDNYRYIRAQVSSSEQIERIHDLGALLMSDAEGIGPVDYLVPPEAMDEVKALGSATPSSMTTSRKPSTPSTNGRARPARSCAATGSTTTRRTTRSTRISTTWSRSIRT
jgi:hypothetical protein